VPLFPSRAQFDIPTTGDANSIVVNWNLMDDQNRPNKRSKTINISFDREAIGDYQDSSAARKCEADNRLQSYISAQLAQFNPNHRAPEGQIPPIEMWIITSETLNG
jgi:hypothetical protein